MENKNKTCCFFGHRTVNVTDGLVKSLREIIEDLIVSNGVDTFLFGSNSEFNDLCLACVSKLKEKYPHIKRIYVRADSPTLSDNHMAFLLRKYEYTYYPQQIANAGRATYIKRNYEMIDKSNYCVIYYDSKYLPQRGINSGTKVAYDYAAQKGLKIINVFDY
ncbi:MAG: hypothetical protein IJT38_05805 [Clostridia bacterium]|nr:hypothetical protein [Clostridia bacterium]